ncbi:hypothetical protein RJT34_09749 [Clitoria ternatea]|uniref:Uncharacterized protein n=1 Tax=Clitoria ternatea TaxID=43366 RepID=A0AAN9PWJ8_CLITE
MHYTTCRLGFIYPNVSSVQYVLGDKNDPIKCCHVIESATWREDIGYTIDGASIISEKSINYSSCVPRYAFRTIFFPHYKIPYLATSKLAQTKP